MNLTRLATTIAAGGVAMWLAAPASDRRIDAPRPAPSAGSARDHQISPTDRDPRSSPTDEVEDLDALDGQIRRLRERMTPAAAPRDPARNLFRFVEPTPTTDRVRRRSAPAAVADKPEPAVVFRLLGIAEDPGPSGPVRTAIISGLGELYLVKDGDDLTLRYRVERVGPDSVDLADVNDASRVTLVFH